MTTIRVTGARSIEEELEKLDGKDRANTERRAVRAATKPFIASMRQTASSSDVPRSFQKIPAARVSTRRGDGGRGIGATVRPKSPLFNIFEPGAGEHEISGDLLAGPSGSSSWDASGRKRPEAFAARGAVSHPGFKGRPITPRAFAAGEAAALKAMADVIFGTSPGEAMG